MLVDFCFLLPRLLALPTEAWREGKSADVRRKKVTLIYPDLMFGKISHHHLNLFQFLFSLDSCEG